MKDGHKMSTVKQMRPLECFLSSHEKKIVLMILNQPLATQIKYFNILWEKASYKVIVDGATNELYRCTSGNLDFIPDLITGDFDSAKPELLNFYKEKVDYFVVLGAFGGRLDHIFSNINTLYEVQDQTTAPILLFGEGSLATLLLEGDYRLHVDTGLESEWCGLIPVSEPCTNVTTTGLKWNLEGQRLQFGSIISTSNTYDKTGVVTITTDKPLLWTMGVKSL
ncbi:hypothetical protein KUTeg_015098 [Tegillarca granosa]|uniref:Thiamin pyrophosphokinase thiamin-binding domain-containing protein n=1 Tax=Tegillarca granosa TaxID=220873 RepID=A0ABQ9EP70_TEGGR|nr:hypothetical protein KUTeg_015098 [Tegillarca granosa]